MSPPAAPSGSPLAPTDLALYAVTVLIFGSAWLPLRFQLGVVDPEVSAVWRFLVASSCMIAIVLATRGRLSFPWRDHLLFAVLGATLFSLNFLSFYYAGFHLTSGLMSVLFALVAVFIPILTAISTRTWPQPRILAGAIVGIVGVGLIFGPELTESGLGSGLHLGLMAGLAGTVLFAFGSMASAIAGRRGLPQASVNAFSMTYGFLFLLAIALLKGATFQVEWTGRYLGALAYLIFFPTLLGFAVYMQLIKRIGASRAGYGAVLFPIVALLLSTAFEQYHWTWSAAAGIALVLTGNVVVLSTPRRA
ncbi:DMT family transporter [Aquabacter spiritensis]|uniref:EamA-like transporter family protein n=1 Tax=Aquabacter spiritensis TaxID=933073 RepID=A0A4R3LUY9_9HYPH|nr:DMT family transporter [Aquabacter spiritensis]TCT03469.1 EamA-like transporter family protein [Aquabacter spiritensis]